MWRATSVILIVAQAAALAAAPLHLCTSARGERRLDFGPMLCVACQPKHHGCGHAHENGPPAIDQETATQPRPCDCEHQALADESQIASRATWKDWSPATCWIAVDAARAPPLAFNSEVSGLCDVAGMNTSLRDLSSILLRC